MSTIPASCAARLSKFLHPRGNMVSRLKDKGGINEVNRSHFQLRNEFKIPVSELCTRDSPGGPLVKTLCFHCMGSIPGQGTKIPHAVQLGPKMGGGGFFLILCSSWNSYSEFSWVWEDTVCTVNPS